MIRLDTETVLRQGTPSDFDSASTLLEARGVPADAVDFERLVQDPETGWGHVGVVEHRGRVVATASWLDQTIELGDVTLPAGQIELVATEVGHEGRGHVRALMHWCHQRMAERAHLLQIMVGIPYFYRRFGYEYSIPMHPYAAVQALGGSDSDVVVRRATTDDIAIMERLQRAAQSPHPVRVPRSAAQWRWVVDRDGSAQYLAIRAGVPVGTARWTEPEDGDVAIAEIVSDTPATTRALLDAAANQPGTASASVMLRPGVPGLHDACGAPEAPGWYYVRLPSLASLWDRLRPVFDSRLANSEFAGLDQDLLISWWRGHLRAPIASGRIGAAIAGGAFQAPVSQGGSGVPPDALGRMIFSDGALAVEARYPDCFLGSQRDLMHVLFPPVTSDVLSWYLP